MLTISEEALALIAKKQLPVTIGIPPSINGCCIEVTEAPSVSFGEPRSPAEYTQQTISGVTVFVPNEFPDDPPMMIKTRSLLGFRQLVIDGWKPL